MRKKQLSKEQISRISEMLGNIAVAWFTAGAISPIFVRSQNILAIIINLIVSLALAGFFAFWSIYLMKGNIKK